MGDIPLFGFHPIIAVPFGTFILLLGVYWMFTARAVAKEDEQATSPYFLQGIFGFLGGLWVLYSAWVY